MLLIGFVHRAQQIERCRIEQCALRLGHVSDERTIDRAKLNGAFDVFATVGGIGIR